MLTVKGSVKTTICVLIFIGVILGLGGYSLVKTQNEKTNALLMQVMLINTAIAQEAYYNEHGAFAQKWGDILTQIARPTTAVAELTPAADRADTCVMRFDRKASYRVSLTPSSQDSLRITATRIDGGLYRYELQYSLPQAKAQCNGAWGMKLFCAQLLRQIEQVDVKNLIPVPSQDKSKQQ